MTADDRRWTTDACRPWCIVCERSELIKGEEMSAQTTSGSTQFLTKMGIIGELLRFLWKRKLWWLIPMIVVLVLFAALLVFAQGSAIAPFIYTLF